jgi:hypothetical protein
VCAQNRSEDRLLDRAGQQNDRIKHRKASATQRPRANVPPLPLK